MISKALDGRAQKIYSLRLRLSQEALEILAKIRSSPPSRRMRADAGNAPVWYPSHKMGIITQAESRTFEFTRILELERDISAPEKSEQPDSLYFR